MAEVYKTYLVNLACKMHSSAGDEATREEHAKFYFKIADFLEKNKDGLHLLEM